MSEESNYKHYTRGGQISFHNLRMWDQITKGLGLICLFTWVALCAALTWYLTSLDIIVQTAYYHWASILKLAGKEYIFHIPHDGHLYDQSVRALTTHPYYAKTASYFLQTLLQCLWVSLVGALGVGAGLALYFVKTGKYQTKNQFVRGSQLALAHELKHQIIRDHLNSDIVIDGFPLIKNTEVQHFLVHGTVGKGKSQFIMKIMDTLRKRGDRVIVYDKGCTFMESYFNSQIDMVLNPYDARCANWDLWCEAPTDPMIENMAESLIPMHGETDPFWVNAARTVFSAAASRMRHDPDRSLDKLLKLLVTGEFEDLEPYLKGTSAATLVSNKIEKTAISIRSVITTYLKSMQSLVGIHQDDASVFSIRDYILNPDEKGWLFISSNGEQHKALKPLISMWIAMASMTLLSLPEDADRRIWFICDELPSLHKLPMLGETIAEVRKFGGCFLLGMQSFAQLEKVYGRSGASEIFDLLNTRAFFASPSSQMAQLVTKELGDEEIDDNRENYSYGANSIRDGISLGKNRITRPIVTYPEIMGLDALTCYLRLPGNYPVTKLKLKHEKRRKKAQGYIQRAGEPFSETNSSHLSLKSLNVNATTCTESSQALMRSRKAMTFDQI